MVPLTNLAQKIEQVDSKSRDKGYSHMIQEKVIKNPQVIGGELAK